MIGRRAKISLENPFLQSRVLFGIQDLSPKTPVLFRHNEEK